MKYAGNNNLIDMCRSKRSGLIVSLILGIIFAILGVLYADSKEMQSIFREFASSLDIDRDIIEFSYWGLIIFAACMTIPQSIGIYKLTVLCRKIEESHITIDENHIYGVGFTSENSPSQRFDIPIDAVLSASSTGLDDGINLTVNTKKGIYMFFSLSFPTTAANLITQYKYSSQMKVTSESDVFLCPKCKNKLSSKGAFCSHCGTKIAPSTPSPKTVPLSRIPVNTHLWVCKNCGHHNRGTIAQCSMCYEIDY